LRRESDFLSPNGLSAKPKLLKKFSPFKSSLSNLFWGDTRGLPSRTPSQCRESDSFINRTPTHRSYGYDFGSRGDVLLPELEKEGHFDEDGFQVRDAIVEGFQKRFPRAPFKEINEPCKLILSFLYGVQDLDEVWHSEDFFQPVGFTDALRNILVFLFEMWGLVFSIPRIFFPCMFTIKLWRARRAIGCFLSCTGISTLIWSLRERLGDDMTYYQLVWVWSYGVFYIINTILPYCMDRQLARGLLFKPFPFTIKGIHGKTTVTWLVPCLGIFFAFFISGIYTIFKDSISDRIQFFAILAQIMAYATFLYGILYWTVNFALSSDIHALQNMKPTNIEIAKMDFYMNHYVSGAELQRKITGYEERRGLSGLRNQESVPFLVSERRSRLVRRKMYQTIEVDDDSSMNSVYAPESYFPSENANQFFSLRPFGNYASADPARAQSPVDMCEAEFLYEDGNHHSASLKGREGTTVSPSPIRQRPRIVRNATPWHAQPNYKGFLRERSSLGFSSGFSYSQLSNSVYQQSKAESEHTDRSHRTRMELWPSDISNDIWLPTLHSSEGCTPSNSYGAALTLAKNSSSHAPSFEHKNQNSSGSLFFRPSQAQKQNECFSVSVLRCQNNSNSDKLQNNSSCNSDRDHTSWEPLFRTPSRSISIQRSMKKSKRESIKKKKKRPSGRKSLEVPDRKSTRRGHSHTIQNSQEIAPYQRKIIYE